MGSILAFDHVKRRYRAGLPHSAMALITRFAVDEAKIAIVTEDEDNVIQNRLALVNPQTGKASLDRTCNERIIAAARVALRGQLADEVMLLNLLHNHMTETLGEGVLRCCSTQPWGSALGFQVGMCFGVAVGLVLGKRPRVPRRGRPAVARLAARTWGSMLPTAFRKPPPPSKAASSIF